MHAFCIVLTTLLAYGQDKGIKLKYKVWETDNEKETQEKDWTY